MDFHSNISSLKENIERFNAGDVQGHGALRPFP